MNSLLLTNSDTRIRSRDAFMLMALWMERFPYKTKTSTAQPTGCVLVSPQDRVVALEHNGESHAVVRAITGSTIDPHGCDIFVSRFPCSLCTKVMVQAGIRKCYYFPAEHWEMHSDQLQRVARSPSLPGNGEHSPVKFEDAEETNKRSVQRLVTNNPIAFSMYIPQWDHSNESLDDFSSYEFKHFEWRIDPMTSQSIGINTRWPTVNAKFKRTQVALNELFQMYNVSTKKQRITEKGLVELSGEANEIAQHAIVLAHIAARRTDDPKIGVGAILVQQGRYISVGWNGFPKKAQHLDYPQAGADDCVDDSELKYNYSLHAEQNALLWRNPPGVRLEKDSFLVTTKMPCDECSPMVSDMGVHTVYTNRQTMRSNDDPLKHKGLSYDKCHLLIENVKVFDK